jgi:bifunctional non-homologous end joining protein LigD
MVSSSEGGPQDNLSRYRAKRSPDTTTEPFGSVAGGSGRLFVVHKHAARQLHFDLRLEMEGVLRSWAVPRGPSYDTNDKRLAVHVEDHPLEYGDFEGIIPAGNYGAGGVIVWDRGEWIDLEDWRTGLEKGKLLFELRGHKLRGRWTLVKIKKSERDWLLIKERDEWARSPGTDFPEESVLSGLTVEEVKEGRGPGVALRRALEEAKAPRERVDLATVQAMQAESADAAFTRDGWVFELKLDGYRLLAGKSHGEVTLLTRKGNDYTAVFPEIARAIRALPFDDIIIDGEVVVLDDEGMPSFARLQRRGRMSSPIEIRHATVEYPATFYAFDLLAFEDFDVRPLPLAARKAILLEAMPKVGIVRGLDHIDREGERFLAQVRELGLEGIIAKKADAPYRGGRSDLWLKIKTEKTADFVIVGYTAPKRGRSGFGALQLADRVGGRLTYAGRAGTGFNDSSSASFDRCSMRSCAPRRRARDRPLSPAQSRCQRARSPRRRRRPGWSRGSSARCATASGRRMGCSAIPPSCGCATTRRRRTASGRAGSLRRTSRRTRRTRRSGWGRATGRAMGRRSRGRGAKRRARTRCLASHRSATARPSSGPSPSPT